MKSLNSITKENFNSSFNITDILQNSVYYPASGIDAKPIEVFANEYNSFVNVDYSLDYDEVKNALESNFTTVGYKLIGIKEISKEELSSKGISPIKYDFNQHEKNRLADHLFVKELFDNASSAGFAIWAVYELDGTLNSKINGKAERFSILHIRGEGWAAFEGLYVENKINPQVIAIIRPGEGYGDNWTLFTDSKFRFYQSIRKNVHLNETEMPKYILSDDGLKESFFWGEYFFVKKHSMSGCNLYELDK